MRVHKRTEITKGSSLPDASPPQRGAATVQVFFQAKFIVHVVAALAFVFGAPGCGSEPEPVEAGSQAVFQSDADNDDQYNISEKVGSQPGEIELTSDGISQLGWLFEETGGWAITGNGVGEGDHLGDDYYFDDWNWGSSNADLGKTLLSPIEGVVIFADVGEERGYGQQVVVRSGDFAFRFTHMDRVDVEVGDKVEPGTVVGTVGCSGLSCVSPYTAHLHGGLYKNIYDTQGKAGRTALYWLERGDNPTYLSGGPSHFAAPFTIDRSIKAPFTLAEASARLSPVLREVELPDNMKAGSTYEARWKIMGYHGPMASVMQIKCEKDGDDKLVVSITDSSPKNEGQGWRWGHAYSNIYSYARDFTLPSGIDTQDCLVRFFWAKQARVGERDTEDIADFQRVYLSVLIPGGVDRRTDGTAGRKLERTIVATGTSGVDGSNDSRPQPSIDPTLSQAAARLSPVMRRIEMDDDLRAGRSTTVTWEIMGYHGFMSSLVKLACDEGDARAYDHNASNLGDGWQWGPADSTRYEFEADLDVPSDFSGECQVRFYWARNGYDDHNSSYLSVLIPGGVDSRPDGDAGRAIQRTVR